MDCFELSDLTVGLLTSKSESGFIKSMTGIKTPQSAILAMSRLHQSWIISGGGEFLEGRFASGRANEECEVSPLVSYEGEDLAGYFWMPIELPCYVPGKQELQDFSSTPLQELPGLSTYFPHTSTKYGQNEFRKEMQHALGLSQSPQQNYQGERVNGSDELPPTPEDSGRAIGSVRQAEAEETHHGEVSARSEVTTWLLSSRVGSSNSKALVGSPGKKLEKSYSLFHARNDGALRFESSRGAGSPEAGIVIGGKAKNVGMYGEGSVRGNILHSPQIDQIHSLRLIPPQTQGLELSEYGRRQVDTSVRDNSWWLGRAGRKADAETTTMLPENAVKVPEELESCAIC